MKNKKIICKIINLFVILIISSIVVYADNPQNTDLPDKNDGRFDDNTGLDKNGYANPNMPIPLSTTEFTLKKGDYTTEEGTKLKVSTETKITRNTDGSFNIGDDKVSGSNIEYNNNQYTIIGQGTLNNIPVSNVKNVQYISKNYDMNSIEIVGEAGDNPSNFDGTVIKPKGAIFVYNGQLGYLKDGAGNIHKQIDPYSYTLHFESDVVLSEINTEKTVEVYAKKGKVILPSGYALESGSVVYDKRQAYVGADTKINGIIMNGGRTLFGFDPDYSIKLFFDKDIPTDVERGISIGKNQFAVKIKETDKSGTKARIEMTKDNPYTKTGLSFVIKNNGGLDIKTKDQKPTNSITLIGNANMWNEKYLISSDGKEVKSYVDSFIKYKKANDINIEVSDIEGKKLLPENIKISKEGRLISKGLTMISISDLEEKYNFLSHGDILPISNELEDALGKNPDRKSRFNLHVYDFKTLQEKCGSEFLVHGCAPGSEVYVSAGTSSASLFHEISHTNQRVNDNLAQSQFRDAYKEAVEKDTLTESKISDEQMEKLRGGDFTWNWKLIAGDVYDKEGYKRNAIPHPGSRDNEAEDIAYFAELAHYPKEIKGTEEWFKDGINPDNEFYDPRIKAKLKLLAGAAIPLMSKETYKKITGEPYSKLTDDEILKVLEFQEDRNQLTEEGKLRLGQLRNIKRTKQ